MSARWSPGREKQDTIRAGVQVGTVVRFKNFGHGPALDARLLAATPPPTTSKILPHKPGPIRLGDGSTGVVPQGREVNIVDVRIGGFDAPTILAIQRGLVKSYVYGRVDYRDQFGDERYTLFCRYLELHETKTGTTGVFSVCPGYDEAH